MHATLLCFILLCLFHQSLAAASLTRYSVIPYNVDFGVATSAFQFEGAWNLDGKGPSMWDNFTHRVPSPISNGQTADVACDTYHRYKEDVALAASLGAKLYRFSFSWPRILPNGYDNKINEAGIQYYKNLLQEILKHNMVPVATIYHWDLPQKLLDDGIHWTNPKIVDVIVKYARIVIKRFPEVGRWTTINEPREICHFGYGIGVHAPGIVSNGLLEYQCAYLVLKAHAAIYRMYKAEFSGYKAKIAAVIDCQWTESFTKLPKDEEAAERQRQFECGMFFHPIFVGDWPKVVKTRIAERSKAANFSKSRLPEFTPEEIKNIKGTHDYIGLNHYYTKLADDAKEGALNVTSYECDVGVVNTFKASWVLESNGIFTIVPYGIRKVLQWLKQHYGDHEVVITELGVTENGSSLNDVIRIDSYHDYICNILAAIGEDKVNVTGIIMWSLLDGFEWSVGYNSHFGLFYVNSTDPSLTRRPKKSVDFFKKIIKDRQLYCDPPRRKWPGPVKWDKTGKPRKDNVGNH